MRLTPIARPWEPRSAPQELHVDVALNISRRTLFGAVVAGAMVASGDGEAALAADHPSAGAVAADAGGQDIELLGLCAAFMALDHELIALEAPYIDAIKTPPAALAEQHKLAARKRFLAEEIVWAQATKMNGLRAKAAVLATYMGEYEGGPDATCQFERIVWGLARDLREIM